MAPIKVERAASNSPAEEHSPSSVLKETVNASKLNELMSNLDKRLAGGLHGEYFEQGSRLDDKSRHSQLQTVFSLRKELADIKAQLDKQDQQAAEAEQARTVGKANAPAASKNMIATIKTVVQQELSEKLRDLSVRNERLEVSVRKADERNETVASRIKTLEVRLKKAEDRSHKLNEKFSDACGRALEERVKAIDIDNEALHIRIAGLERRNCSLEQQVQRLEERNSDVGNMNPLQITMEQLGWDFHGCTERLNQLEEWRDACGDEDDEHGGEEGEYGDQYDECWYEAGECREDSREDEDEDDESISSSDYGL